MQHFWLKEQKILQVSGNISKSINKSCNTELGRTTIHVFKEEVCSKHEKKGHRLLESQPFTKPW